MNGHAVDMTASEGQLAVQERLGPRKLINRTEFVRLLEQALHRLGYPDVAGALEQRAVLEAHTDEVWHIAFSNNGTMLASGSKVLEAHTDEVWHIAFSNNGTMLASGSKDRTAILWSDRTAILWSVQSPTQLAAMHKLCGHSQPVAFLSWSPDDRRIITCSEETLRLWDVATGRLLHCCSHHREAVTSCAWLPDGRRFVSGGADRAVSLVDAASGAELQRWKRSYRVQ
ncbi:putative serine/threonine-protein kinase, partial [Tetrabaena socialis]